MRRCKRRRWRLSSFSLPCPPPLPLFPSFFTSQIKVLIFSRHEIPYFIVSMSLTQIPRFLRPGFCRLLPLLFLLVPNPRSRYFRDLKSPRHLTIGLVSVSLTQTDPSFLETWSLLLCCHCIFRFRYLRDRIQVSSSSDDPSCLHVPKQTDPSFLET